VSPPPRTLKEASRLARKYYPHFERYFRWRAQRYLWPSGSCGPQQCQANELLGWFYECWVHLWTYYDPTRGSAPNLFEYVIRSKFRGKELSYIGGRTTSDHNGLEFYAPRELSELEKYGSLAFEEGPDAHPLDRHKTCPSTEGEWAAELIEELGGLAALIALIQKRCDTRTAEILIRAARGETLSSVAVTFGVTKQRVSQLWQKGAERLRYALLTTGKLKEPWADTTRWHQIDARFPSNPSVESTVHA
jgi:hypothetical protein